MVERIPVPVATRAPHGETNAFLAGDPLVLIDPAGRSAELDSTVSDHHRDIEHLAVTHTHPDHVGAVAHYATETDATVWCRYGRRDEFERATGTRPDVTFVDGTELGDTGIVVMETPGHAPEHTAFLAGPDAIVGDLLTADGSVFVGKPGGDMRAYFASLRRLLAHDLDTLQPGHGGSVIEPHTRIREVLAHRQDRERRVEAAVRDDGAQTVEEILHVAYDKDLTGLEDLAARTVRAHLQKLDVEGRIRWEGETATPPDS